MTESSETPSALNFLRLNGSSFETSSFGISTSQPKGKIIQFEEYKQPVHTKPTSAGRNLTIKIQQNFGYAEPILKQPTLHRPNLTLQIPEDSESLKQSQSSSLNHSHSQSSVNHHKSYIEPLNQPSRFKIMMNKKQKQRSPKSSSSSSSSSSLQCSEKDDEQLQQVERLTNRVGSLQQKLFYFQDYNKKLLQQLQRSKQIIEENRNEVEKLNLNIKKKDEMIELYKEKNDLLNTKIMEIQKEKEQIKIHPTKTNHQQNCKEIPSQKRYEKIVNINKQLQKELREAEKKLVELEKEMHKTTCHNFYQNMTRLKESSLKVRQTSGTNKENQTQMASNQQRKSLEIKKNNPTKAQRTNSSNLNILAKKLAHSFK